MDGQKVNNISTFKILAEVFGICQELCTDLHIKYQTVLAGTWKSTLNIKGKTRAVQKKGAQEWVKQHYNLNVIQDIVDAICIGTHYFERHKSELNWE